MRTSLLRMAIRFTYVLVAAIALGAGVGLLASSPRAEAQRPPNVTGVGVYPSIVEVPSALRGERYETGTVLINTSGQPRKFTFGAEKSDGDIASWVSFATADAPATLVTEAIAPANGELHIMVYVSVPSDAASQAYTGAITYASSSTTGESAVVLNIRQEVQITVTGKQVLNVELGDLFTNQIEVGQPLSIQARIVNRSNVSVNPTIVASIRSVAGAEVARDLQGRLERFRPSEEKSLPVLEWDSKNQQPGDYVVDYRLLAQGVEFAKGSAPFTLAPFGTLSRAGEIEGITFHGALAAGSTSRADVVFKNTGRIDARAKFEGELYRGGTLLTPVESRSEVLARAGEEVTLQVFFPVEKNGKHELRGHVTFEGARTAEAVATFGEGGLPFLGEVPSMGVLAAGGAVVVALVMAVVILRRRPATVQTGGRRA